MPIGPIGEPRLTSIGPFVEKSLVGELESAIADEQGAETEYQKLIDLLEQDGRSEMADRVRSIQENEVKHREELKSMLREIQTNNA